jgi:2-phospho-L-lactate guanylyltransferase
VGSDIIPTVPVTAVVPIRSFDGLTRLSSVLDDEARAALMRRMAERTTMAAERAGASVAVVTGDASVRSWAKEQGWRTVAEPDNPGLNRAAGAGVAGAQGPWLVVHADLPAIGVSDIETALSLIATGVVLAPSHDGGTSLIGGPVPGFPFSYGVGSFRRHLAAVPGAAVLVRPGLALDLDRASDLGVLRTLGAVPA